MKRKKTPLQFFKAVYGRLYYYCAPDKIYLNDKFKKVFGRDINWKNPTTYNEKLQWLKIYDRNPLYTQLVDKYEVRKYIAKQMGEKYLIPCLGIYDKFEDIDFELLPEKFVLKCTHDSNSVVVCRDRKTFDKKSACEKLTRNLKQNFYYNLREWPYKHVKPRIIAEEYMQDTSSKELKDYKFYCFNGTPRFLYLSEGLENHETARISYVNLDWSIAPFKRLDFQSYENLPEKPLNFELMLKFAAKLSEVSSFARVDFYEINGRLYFGEITFYPGGGFTKFEPKQYDEIVGNMLLLDK